MRYLGDFVEDDTVVACFNTRQADGTPITLGGTPAVSVYKDGGTTESTAGVTLTVDFDSRTGLHLVAVDTSADAFYATGSDYSIVVTTGTVDSVSVVGTEVASFSIENRYTAAGGGGGDATAANQTTIINHLTGIKGATFDGSTDSLEAIRNRGDAAWVTASGFSTLDGDGVRAAVGLASANLDTQFATAQADLDILTGTDGAVIASGTQTFNITGDITGNLSGSVGSVTGNVGGNVSGSVGSVTGSVGGNVTGSIGSLATQAKADVGDAVCDEMLSGHTTAGTVGKALADVLEDTGTTLPGLITTGPVSLPSVVQASVGASESTIEIIQGDYGYTYSVAVTDAAGDAVNLTSTGTLTFIVESTADAADVATYTATGTSTGFTWVPTSAVSLTAGSYRWALKEALTGPTGVRTWAYGTFDVITAAVVDA